MVYRHVCVVILCIAMASWIDRKFLRGKKRTALGERDVVFFVCVRVLSGMAKCIDLIYLSTSITSLTFNHSYTRQNENKNATKKLYLALATMFSLYGFTMPWSFHPPRPACEKACISWRQKFSQVSANLSAQQDFYFMKNGALWTHAILFKWEEYNEPHHETDHCF